LLPLMAFFSPDACRYYAAFIFSLMLIFTGLGATMMLFLSSRLIIFCLFSAISICCHAY